MKAFVLFFSLFLSLAAQSQTERLNTFTVSSIEGKTNFSASLSKKDSFAVTFADVVKSLPGMTVGILNSRSTYLSGSGITLANFEPHNFGNAIWKMTLSNNELEYFQVGPTLTIIANSGSLVQFFNDVSSTEHPNIFMDSENDGFVITSSNETIGSSLICTRLKNIGVNCVFNLL